MRSFGKFTIGPKDEARRNGFQRVVNHVIKFLSTSRNASVVIVFTAITMYLDANGTNPFRLTGNIPKGMPTPSLPPFSIKAQPGNETAGIPPVEGQNFLEMVQSLGYGLVIVPLMALLETMSVCKAFAKGRQIDITQEMIACGVGNIATSIFSGYRCNGGLARSAVNNASGCRTNMSNLYIGIIVVLALNFLTDYFAFIPKAVLAAIIISAVIFQVQYQVVTPMWRSKRELGSS